MRFSFLSFLFSCCLAVSAQVMESPLQRVMVLTDIENEPDDTESLVRLLMYSNDFDLRGLIATTSTHMRNRVAPESIHALIDAYAKVRPNLLLHADGFPEADVLHKMVKSGLPRYGMNGVGKGKDSEGSLAIIHELERDDPRPLWICAWGGTTVLAQALYKIRSERSGQELKRMVGKLRVYAIADQDDTGQWLRREFPALWYITSGPVYQGAAWTAMSSPSPITHNSLVSPEWVAAHIQQGHGPLAALYPDWAYTMEGDSPSFLGLIANGLSHMEHPDWGGWGGRFQLKMPEHEAHQAGSFGVPNAPETRPYWNEAADTLTDAWGSRLASGREVALLRWRDDFQRDFAARMDWCVKSFSEANHKPVPVVKLYTSPTPRAEDTPERREITTFTVKSGQHFCLDATGSSDPDGDNLSYHWHHYNQATGMAFIPVDDNPTLKAVRYTAPQVSHKQFMHIILRITDKGTPRLTAYARIIIKIIP